MAAREAWTDERLDDLNKLLLFGGMYATSLVGFLGVIATILTQT